MGDTFMANCCAQSNGRSFVAHMMCKDGGAQVGGATGKVAHRWCLVETLANIMRVC